MVLIESKEKENGINLIIPFKKLTNILHTAQAA